VFNLKELFMDNISSVEFKNTPIGQAMTDSWKSYLEESEQEGKSIESPDFFAGFENCWNILQEKITSLEKRVHLAEMCMATVWGNSIIPNGDAIVAPLKEYRKEYPTALKGEKQNE
jgi:hypothetical protein